MESEAVSAVQQLDFSLVVQDHLRQLLKWVYLDLLPVILKEMQIRLDV